MTNIEQVTYITDRKRVYVTEHLDDGHTNEWHANGTAMFYGHDEHNPRQMLGAAEGAPMNQRGDVLRKWIAQQCRIRIRNVSGE